MVNKIEEDLDRKTELSNCNFVKTVLMLIVVFYHSILYWNGDWFTGEPAFPAPLLGNFAEWMNTFHIYCFTLVSGYIFYYLKCEKEKYERFLPFLANKAKRLLIPYAAVSLAWVIPFAMYFFRYDATEIFVRFGLGTSPNQLWFLLMLFFVFAIFHPLSKFFEKNTVGGAIVVLVFYGIGLFGPSFVPNVFQIFRAFMYLPVFWIGFKIRQCGSRYLKKIPAVLWLLVHVLLFLLLKTVSAQEGTIYSLLRLGLAFLTNMVGAVMAFVILQKLADRVKWQENKPFAFLIKNAMPVYLFHQQVVYVCIALLDGRIPSYLHAGVNFIGAMAVSLLLSALLMKFRFTKILIGEK